ncbi:MAG TPA: phenylalanine--tRNA ligase beta subunit-related protein [Vicinamibacterales bacterium]
MHFTLAPDLATIVRPGVLWLEGATVVEREHRMDAPLAAAESDVRINPPQEVTAVRTMYKRVGLDPTKTRPSSEALLRRIRKGDTLPRINSMVDVCNWCSMEFQLPYGLYDAARIDGDVELRIGRPGESYPGIRKDDVNVGGRIALVDRLGPFGNPTSDSSRTMVTIETTKALLVVFAPREVDRVRIDRVLDATSSRMAEFTGCREVARSVE